MKKLLVLVALLLSPLAWGAGMLPIGSSIYPILIFELVQNRIFTQLPDPSNCAPTPEAYDSLSGYICRATKVLKFKEAGTAGAASGDRYFIGRLTENPVGYKYLLELWEDSAERKGATARKTLMYYRNGDGKKGKIYWAFNDPLADGYPVALVVEWDSTQTDHHWFRVIEQVQKPTGSATAWANRDHAVRMEGESFPQQSLVKASYTLSMGASGSSPAYSILASSVRNAYTTVSRGETRTGEDFSSTLPTTLAYECSDNRNKGTLMAPLYTAIKLDVDLSAVLAWSECGTISSETDFRPLGRDATEEFLGVLTGAGGYTLRPNEPAPTLP